MSVALLLTGVSLFSSIRYHRGRPLQRAARPANQHLEVIAIPENHIDRTKLEAYKTKQQRQKTARFFEGDRSRYILDVDAETLETFRLGLLAAGYRVQVPRGFIQIQTVEHSLTPRSTLLDTGSLDQFA